MNTYFFGVFDPRTLGHYLFERTGQRVERFAKSVLPFNHLICDGNLLHQPEQQGRPHLAHVNGWTILGAWDRTADSRPNSSASFLFEGVFTLEQALQMADAIYPELYARILKPWQDDSTNSIDA